MEDILEELVGEIWDEHDEVVEEMEKVSEAEFIVRGSANAEKLFEMLGIDSEPEAVTASGWVMDEMSCVPKAGDEFAFEGYRVKVLEMNGRRVEKIQITASENQDT